MPFQFSAVAKEKRQGKPRRPLQSEFPNFNPKNIKHFCLLNHINNMKSFAKLLSNFISYNFHSKYESYWHIESYFNIIQKTKKDLMFFGQNLDFAAIVLPAGSDYTKQNVLAIHALYSQKVPSIKSIEIFLKFEIKPKYPSVNFSRNMSPKLFRTNHIL